MDKLAPINCSKHLTIYLILSPNKLFLPKNCKEEIDKKHVNSAFTFSCQYNNQVFIYRSENAFKVVVHELIHALGLDFSSMDGSLANKIITDNFKGLDKKCDYRVYESYCESWAQIINILILVSREKNGNYMKKINEFLFYEKLWSIFQCGKVLYHYGIQYNKLLNGNDKYTETKTTVFSYYILRAICMANFNEFINLSYKKNSNIIVFKKTQENIKNYCNMLNNLSKCQIFKKELNIVEEWFNNGKFTKIDLIPLQSMRMSIS